MKKKLFVWYYKHSFHVCALTEDGEMLVTAIPSAPSTLECAALITMLFSDNNVINETYEVKIQDQAKLEKHMYEGSPRDEGVPKDFQIAWDKYRAGGVQALN